MIIDNKPTRPDQKVSIQGPVKTNYLTYHVAVQLPSKVGPFTHQTLVPAVLSLSEALLEMTFSKSQQPCHYVAFYLVKVLKPIPLQQHFHLWELKKSHRAMSGANRGCGTCGI